MSRRIPIKKTNRTVPKSTWWWSVAEVKYYQSLEDGVAELEPVVVTDLSVGLDNPLILRLILDPYNRLNKFSSVPNQPLHKRLTKLFRRKRK